MRPCRPRRQGNPGAAGFVVTLIVMNDSWVTFRLRFYLFAFPGTYPEPRQKSPGIFFLSGYRGTARETTGHSSMSLKLSERRWSLALQQTNEHDPDKNSSNSCSHEKSESNLDRCVELHRADHRLCPGAGLAPVARAQSGRQSERIHRAKNLAQGIDAEMEGHCRRR